MKTIYHLAISRLKYNKGRSILTIVAVALMTTLLMSIGSSAFTVIWHQQLEIEENARNYHAAFKGSTADQVFILENHTDVESLSTRENVASIELPKLNAFLNFDFLRKGSIDQIQLADGKMPVEADEIAGPPAFFERLGVIPETGQKFQIPLRIQGGRVENNDFTITGILEQTDISKLNVNETRLVYGAFISEKFVEQHISPEDRTYTAYIRIANEKEYSKDEIKTIVTEIAEDIGLNKSDVSFNEEYLTYMTNPGTQERNIMIGLGLLVVFLGGMVIYSIYYVSVISNIQEMGKLKALGATKKHIRRLLFTESLVQSLIGIPCGILLGYLATVFLFRVVILSGSTLEDTFWHWQVAICVVAVVLLTVGISVRKPLKMASVISPVEAMRYQEPVGKQKRKKSFKTLSVSKLSYANLQRNKRRTVVRPEKFESVKTQIDALQQENVNFMFKAYDEELGIAKQLIRTIQYTIYGLLIVIGIIGYISLINTMITSILVRKKELGILQAIGLSDKQLCQMIHREGMFFTFGTLALSLTIGNGLGYLLIRIIISTQILKISQYKFPIIQTLVLIVAVAIGQIAITVFVNRYIHKQSLVERMRD